MAEQTNRSGPGLKLERYDWPVDIDPYIGLAVALIESEGQPHRVLRRSPERSQDGKLALPVFAKLKKENGKIQNLPELKIPSAYIAEDTSCVTGTIELDPSDPASMRNSIVGIRGKVQRLKLALPKQPHLEDALGDIRRTAGIPRGPVGQPPGDVDGSGVIVGIVDDGCALAHPNFLTPEFKSRILYFWDQSQLPTAEDIAKGWSRVEDFRYGRELQKRGVDYAITAHVRDGAIEEDKIYAHLRYEVGDVSSHGTHVMDIAAGNGQSLAGYEGVAPGADIIFVQLPAIEIGNPADSVLACHILDAVMYVFSRAKKEGKDAVVNISYGGYGGPHDGTSLVECGIDELLDKDALSPELKHPNRAVVVAAGNAFDKNCHAFREVNAGKTSEPLRWMVSPEDPTLNLMEIWYDKDAELEVRMTSPDQGTSLGPVGLGKALSIQQPEDDKIVGWIFHRAKDSGNSDNHVLIALRPTIQEASNAKEARTKVAAAPPGTWQIQLTNVGTRPAQCHAWIERDDAIGLGGSSRLQSRFFEEDVSPECTLSSLATGKNTIAVGGYNTATQEVCAYSACGPTRTREKHGPSKPEVCAPAAEDVAGRGILSASSLSAQPTRMNGTSAAAPFVTGLVALIFQTAGPTRLSTDEIREKIAKGAKRSPELMPNSRLEADPTRLHKQSELLHLLVGHGKINVRETLV